VQRGAADGGAQQKASEKIHKLVPDIEGKVWQRSPGNQTKKPTCDHAPDLSFKKAKAESNAAQKDLI
jgi:hypothetical protein